MYADKFKYLGHIINNRLNDNDDICREIKNLFITRCNMLINRFNKSSVKVKCVLFRTYCLCMYDIGLWKHYNITAINKFRSAYHKSIKKFFGFLRMDSMTNILLLLKQITITHCLNIDISQPINRC